ncbi:hypothetical protein OUZ56_014435 [Daphnia magna]|uniref:Uncharacterized protein n=1 Tax=Daphnia magna TaxID=35525 RepID=A0ABR0AJR8_9CRUS|nr:hypothetical protein OUZ56_014435 [Daphnia magna]
MEMILISQKKHHLGNKAILTVLQSKNIGQIKVSHSQRRDPELQAREITPGYTRIIELVHFEKITAYQNIAVINYSWFHMGDASVLTIAFLNQASMNGRCPACKNVNMI